MVYQCNYTRLHLHISLVMFILQHAGAMVHQCCYTMLYLHVGLMVFILQHAGAMVCQRNCATYG